MKKTAPPPDQRPEWYQGYVGENDHVLRSWQAGLPARSHNSNLRTDGLDLWSWETRIGRTYEGRKQLLDVRGSKAFISHTTTEHVNLAESFADEIIQPVIVRETPGKVEIGRERKREATHWCYFPGEGFGDEPTDQTDYKVVFRLDGKTPIALFPEIPMDVEGLLVKVYDPRQGMYAGHYNEIIKKTSPAPDYDERVLALIKDLQYRGYTYIKTVDRATTKMHEARVSAAKAVREAQGKAPFDLYDYVTRYEAGELDDAQEIELFQHLVDTGMAWQLPGSIGVRALKLLEEGKIFR